MDKELIIKQLIELLKDIQPIKECKDCYFNRRNEGCILKGGICLLEDEIDDECIGLNQLNSYLLSIINKKRQ